MEISPASGVGSQAVGAGAAQPRDTQPTPRESLRLFWGGVAVGGDLGVQLGFGMGWKSLQHYEICRGAAGGWTDGRTDGWMDSHHPRHGQGTILPSLALHGAVWDGRAPSLSAELGKGCFTQLSPRSRARPAAAEERKVLRPVFYSWPRARAGSSQVPGFRCFG